VSATPAQPPPGASTTPPVQPISQRNNQMRHASQGWIWWQQRPKREFPNEPDPQFKLVPDDLIERMTTEFNLDPGAVARMKKDIDYLDHELLKYFRETDHAAKKYQNGFRLYNVRILMLATGATLIGTLQAISLAFSPSLLLVLGALETIVALYTVYVVNTRSTEASLDSWLKNRRQSEQLRREFFRYLLYLPPYIEGELEYERKRKLSSRAASIYADQFPEEPSILESGNPTMPGAVPPSTAYSPNNGTATSAGGAG